MSFTGPKYESLLRSLIGDDLATDEPMSRHTTLRVGGPARWFWAASDTDRLARVLASCTENEVPYLFLGHGSNVLMADAGYDGLIIQNRCKTVEVGASTVCDSGVSLGALFHHTARAGYTGLEWAVGIPGTVGGALVSNAGAYRGNIGPLVRTIRLVESGVDQTVGAEWMEFSYRDSKLRRAGVTRTVILSCTLELAHEGDPAAILERAREYQTQRRGKQPYAPSAGSFFKNVISRELAESLDTLTPGMRAAGVVPAGYLIEACGLKGLRIGGAQSSDKHANFLINPEQNAKAADFAALAQSIKATVRERFGVTLEEEVLYLGDWSSALAHDPVTA